MNKTLATLVLVFASISFLSGFLGLQNMEDFNTLLGLGILVPEIWLCIRVLQNKN